MKKLVVTALAALMLGATTTACQHARISEVNEPAHTTPPVWDEQAAEAIIGKTVLIGITVGAHGDRPESQEQMYGVIVQADRKNGFRVALQGSGSGKDYWLPPQTTNFVPAQPGIYRLRGNGEEVENPDYTSTWTIESPSR